VFFKQYLAAPIVIALYLGWKVYTKDWRLYIPAHEVDLASNVRMHIPGEDNEGEPEVRTWKNLPSRIFHSLF
jgi:amino acid transporter